MSSFRALFTLWDLPGSQASLLLLHLRQSHEPQHSEQIQNRFRTDSEQIQNRNNQNRTEPANRGFPSGFLQRDDHDFRTVRHLVAWKWRYPGYPRPCGPKSSTNGVPTPGDAARHVGIEGVSWDKHS